MKLGSKVTNLFIGGALIAIALPAIAGSGGSPGERIQASPESLAKVIAGHLERRDAAAIEPLFAPIDLLEKVARCEDDDDDLRDDIRESRRELNKLVRKHGGSTFVRLEVDEHRQLAVGTRFEDCVAKEPLGWFEGDVHTSRGDDFDIDMIRIGDRWFVVDFDD